MSPNPAVLTWRGQTALDLGAFVTSTTPLAWWRFEEASGSTSADSSGNGHGLTVYAGSPVLGASPVTLSESSYSTSVASGATWASDNSTGWAPPGGSVSATIVFKLNTVSGTQHLVGRNGGGSGDTGSPLWILRSEGTSLVSYWNGGGSWSTISGGPLTTGTMYVASIVNSTTGRALWLNGVSIASETATGNIGTFCTTQITMGASIAGGASEGANGYIDDTIIHGYRLSDANVLTLHNKLRGL